MFRWILFFFIYCFLGWCFESAYVSIKEKRLVNRGFLNGPLLPIYGFGAIIMLVITEPVKNNYLLIYSFGAIGATILEFFTGYFMEKIFKMKYWDYSDKKLNFKGHICLSSSVAWGFFAILLTKVIHKPIEAMVLNMNEILLICLDIVILLLFIPDYIISFKSAFNLGKIILSINDLMDNVSNELEEIIDNAEELLEKGADEIKEKLDEIHLLFVNKQIKMLKRNPTKFSNSLLKMLKKRK